MTATTLFRRCMFKRVLHIGTTGNVFKHIQERCKSNIAAFSVVYSEYGDPNKVLQSRTETLSPDLKSNDVLIKMLMAPLNPSDINMIEGTYLLKPDLPAVVGNEGVAEVMEVGANVKSLQKGDWVFPSQAGFGTWRTHAVANEATFKKIANDIPPVSAATLAVNPTTAYRMLKDFGNLKPGDFVIQNSANSGVGQSVIQIAKAWDLKTINIVRNRENIDTLVKELKSIGADHVVTEEFCRTTEMKDLIRSLKEPPKLALNGVGGKSATELLRHLAPQGTMVTYGGMSKKPVIIPTGVFIFKEVTTVGYWNSRWNTVNAESEERTHMLNELCDMIRECKLIPPACQLYKLENFTEAVKNSMAGFQGKKTLLVMQEFD